MFEKNMEVQQMTDEKKTTQENKGTPLDMASCIEMMETMMAQHGEGCGCAEMMSGMMSQTDSGNCVVMMETCCDTQRGVEK